jgi:predicted dehydrogenase
MAAWNVPPIPNGFDWDKWIGPAPFRTYNPAYAPFAWRNWRDFGTGSIGDFGCHILDPAMWAIGLPKKITIEASSSALNKDSYAVANTVQYRFIAPEIGGPVTLTWYDGGLRPFKPSAMEFDKDLPTSGGLYIGDEGIIVAPHGGESQLVRKTKVAKYQAPKPSLPRNENHFQEWVRACKHGDAPLSNFEYAGPLTEMVLLGNIAIETGKLLEWDSDLFKIINVPDANALLHRQYREGWTL